MKRNIFTFIFLLLLSIQTQAQIDIQRLDAYIEQSRKAWNIPGLAIAIVKDDSVIFQKGYGTTLLGGSDKVDENTLFAIASNSKAFTAHALGILVDEGKLSWDDPVQKHLPYFQLYDPYVSQQMTIRDLLSHRSGLFTFSGDLLWYHTNYSSEEIVKRARYLEPKYGFREQFGYSNIMYIAAGEVLKTITGKSWTEFIQEKFLTPLKMDRTTTTVTVLDKTKNVATPHHVTSSGEIIPVPYLNWDAAAAAAAINSSVADMSQWIKLQINMGELNGTRYFSEEVTRETRQVQTNLYVSSFSEKYWPSTHFKGYGMGWSVQDYLGVKLINHGGGSDGMISKVCIVPEEKLGFVILTNSINSLSSALMYTVLDEYFRQPDKNWSDFYLKMNDYGNQQDLQSIADDAAQKALNTKPCLPLAEYAGRYTSDLYGDILVSVKNNQLKVVFEPASELNASLQHWHYDTFSLKFDALKTLPEGKVSFLLNAQGKVEEMKIDVPNPDFYFTELKLIKTKEE